MTVYKNTGQSAAAAGTALDATNGALPDAPSLIVPGSGGAITIQTTTSPGTKAIRVTPAAATQGYWGYTGMSGGTNSFAARGLWKSPSSLPGSFQPIVTLKSSGGGAPVGYVAISATNHFQVGADTAGTSVTGSGAITADTWYDLSIQAENPTASTGVMVLTVRNLSNVVDTGLSTTHGGGLGAGTANFGTSAMAHVRLGKVGTAGNLGATDWKYWTFQTGSSVELPQPGANTAPSVPAITPKIQGGGSTTFTAVPTDAEGDSLTYSWTGLKPDGTTLTGMTGTTTATVTVPNQGTAGSYVLTCVVNDGTDTTSVTTYLYVPQASGTGAKPDRLVSNGGVWTYGGTATTLVDAVRGTDSAKWISTKDGPGADSIVYHMEVPAAGHYDVSFYIRWTDTDGVTAAAGVTGSITGQVFQGTTPITTQKIFQQPLAAWLQVGFSFTTLEDTALSTDLKDIRIEFTATQ